VIGTIKRKSLLYRSGVEYGDFCINHVEGCSHGCLYPCYAMMLKKRAGVISNYADWRKPKLTDPFMYGHDEVEKLSIEIIRRLNSNNITCTLLTKGIYPIKDNKPK
jgi:hypothetical protein